MAEPKPGKKTTEFALALLSIIVSALVAAGAFTEAAGCDWQWCGPVATIVGIAGTVLTALGYGKLRSDLKAGK